jgi:hypothetical protein
VWTLCRREKFPAPAGIRNPIIRPVASRYTDWAIPVLTFIILWRYYLPVQTKASFALKNLYWRLTVPYFIQIISLFRILNMRTDRQTDRHNVSILVFDSLWTNDVGCRNPWGQNSIVFVQMKVRNVLNTIDISWIGTCERWPDVSCESVCKWIAVSVGVLQSKQLVLLINVVCCMKWEISHLGLQVKRIDLWTSVFRTLEEATSVWPHKLCDSALHWIWHTGVNYEDE